VQHPVSETLGLPDDYVPSEEKSGHQTSLMKEAHSRFSGDFSLFVSVEARKEQQTSSQPPE
jgi:hypothetical protein